MSYQVLARKWRPKRFREMAGQEHVLQAIINGLDHDRLHHAYLFTGTRGVGKTTIARIFAKCLNCESGVSSEPCGTCHSCTEINENRFIDLIEVDAASRTKVEDTRELLENVQYAPTKGRYKVYLIDEVHMLSNSSFNALLKTLEEPPPHVKFLLATTDPQKLPATVLSRCLQFNLKNLSPERIVQHLKDVLQQEMVHFDEPALWLLGRAANGSMRDALSLTDQAIAFGSGKVLEPDVATMLGTIDTSYIVTMLQALANHDAAALLAAVDHMSEHSPDYQAALEAMLLLLHRITVAQMVPSAVDNAQGDREQVLALAQLLSPGDVQLFYQLGLHARRDLPLAPDPRSGYEMAMLRMMAFKPQAIEAANARNVAATTTSGGNPEVKKPNPVSSAAAVLEEVSVAANPVQESSYSVSQESVSHLSSGAPYSAAAIMQSLKQDDQQAHSQDISSSPPASPKVQTIDQPDATPISPSVAVDPDQPARATECFNVPDNEPQEEVDIAQELPQTLAPLPTEVAPVLMALETISSQSWPSIYGQLDLSGVAKSVISHCALEAVAHKTLHFVLEQRNAGLFNEAYTTKLQESLARLTGQAVELTITVGEPSMQTPAQYMQVQAEARQAEAERRIHADPNVQMLMQRFDASILPESIEPMTSEEKA
jgi:DNA polymerase III subunit gamma/tau